MTDTPTPSIEEVKERLKPCPFCGSEAIELSDFGFSCPNKNCPVAYVAFHKSQWNTRAESATITALQSELAEMREALEWYAEQAEGCRKLGYIGDPFRHALDVDGGKRARATLKDRPNTAKDG